MDDSCGKKKAGRSAAEGPKLIRAPIPPVEERKTAVEELRRLAEKLARVRLSNQERTDICDLLSAREGPRNVLQRWFGAVPLTQKALKSDLLEAIELLVIPVSKVALEKEIIRDAGKTLVDLAAKLQGVIDAEMSGQAGEAAADNSANLQPLTDSQREVYETIRKEGPLQGPQIATKFGISESTLTAHYIPALKLHGIVNRRGLGYYHPETYHPD